jgi:hypothetical protein
MPTKVLQNNEVRVPFLGDKFNSIGGLDPLGMQISSNQIYAHLLSGLNNVTHRIRNYSFYCWLLNEYSKIIQDADTYKQRKFIRRAEYILALAAFHKGLEGISGRNYAASKFYEGLKTFDLQEGTYNEDDTTVNTYWQYTFGVFGQYYLGSIQQIGIVVEVQDENRVPLTIYNATSKSETDKICGMELASAFEKNIKLENKNTFLKAIDKGKINISQLESIMDDFDLTNIPRSNERDLLIQLLKSRDNILIQEEVNTYNRKETFQHVLRFIDENNYFGVYDFTVDVYNKKGIFKNVKDDCLTGWYYYQLNEYYQIANTGILNAILSILESEKSSGWMHLNDLFDIAIEEITSGLKELGFGKITSVEDVVSETEIEEVDLLKKLKESHHGERLLYSILLLFKVFKENNTDFIDLKNYSNNLNISNSKDALDFYFNFQNHLNDNFVEFVKNHFYTEVLLRHLTVAYRKLANGNQSTQKFILENNYIRLIDNFEPNYTSPRLNSVYDFIRDLKLVKDNKLTEDGKSFLNS